MEEVRGYKVFNSDWSCSPNGSTKQYTCPGKFEEDVTPVRCGTGMHFCRKASDCFNYYNFNPGNKVAEVIAYGKLVEEGDKCCTNKLEIVREIPWQELLNLVNQGKGCTGLCNSGDRNSGNRNSGDRNSGNRNSGDCNSGDRNSGDCNSGNWNSGNRNSGDRNSGDRNSGDRNSGNRNSGDCNSGDRNSGDRNSGNRNSGNRNSGDCNSGDWNKSSFVAGCFNTENHNLLFFDKPTNMTYEQWRRSDAYHLMNQIDFRPTEWVYESDMSEDEKDGNPDWEINGGYLKVRDNVNCHIDWWKGLSDHQKNTIKAIPNFNADKFYTITGIDVRKEDK